MATALPYINTASAAISAGAGLYSAIKPGESFPQANAPAGRQPVYLSNPYSRSILGYSLNLSESISNPYQYKTSVGEIRGK